VQGSFIGGSRRWITRSAINARSGKTKKKATPAYVPTQYDVHLSTYAIRRTFPHDTVHASPYAYVHCMHACTTLIAPLVSYQILSRSSAGAAAAHSSRLTARSFPCTASSHTDRSVGICRFDDSSICRSNDPLDPSICRTDDLSIHRSVDLSIRRSVDVSIHRSVELSIR
jgi:hypothetical protein